MRPEDRSSAPSDTDRVASSGQERTNRWPPQIKYIVGNEACERFSYYGMRSILAGYITGAVLKGGLGQDEDTAAIIIHFFIFTNYFMPLLGAWLSDKLIGRYHTILWVSLFYCAGHGVLACSDYVGGGVQGKMWCLYAGLALIAFGSGGIKPCVSACMGDQFKPEQSHLLQKAYGAFYWSINLGSFFSFLVIPAIKNHYNYSLAFGVPGILIGIATFIFWLGTKYYVRIPPSRETRKAGFLSVFAAAYRNRPPGDRLLPSINILTALGIPLAAMAAFTFVAVFAGLQGGMTLFTRIIGWTALFSVAVWYGAIVVISLLGKSDLGENFWQSARNRYSPGEIDAARSVGPILFVFALIPVFFSLFDQSTSTWVLRMDRSDRRIRSGFSTARYQSRNSAPAKSVVTHLMTEGFSRGTKSTTSVPATGRKMRSDRSPFIRRPSRQQKIKAHEAEDADGHRQRIVLGSPRLGAMHAAERGLERVSKAVHGAVHECPVEPRGDVRQPDREAGRPVRDEIDDPGVDLPEKAPAFLDEAVHEHGFVELVHAVLVAHEPIEPAEGSRDPFRHGKRVSAGVERNGQEDS